MSHFVLLISEMIPERTDFFYIPGEEVGMEHSMLKTIHNKIVNCSKFSDEEDRHMQSIYNAICDPEGDPMFEDAPEEALTPEWVGKWYKYLETSNFPFRYVEGFRPIHYVYRIGFML